MAPRHGERGFVAIDRGVFDNPAFTPERFSEREAWIWLISEAEWKQRKRRIGRGAGACVVTLERGQVGTTARFMAQAFGWALGKVQRYLDRLAELEMVSLDSRGRRTIVTIVNYDRYQASPPGAVQNARHNVNVENGTMNGTMNGTIESDASHCNDDEIGVDPGATGTMIDTMIDTIPSRCRVKPKEENKKTNIREARAAPRAGQAEISFEDFKAGYPGSAKERKYMAWRRALREWSRLEDADRRIALASLSAWRSFCADNPKRTILGPDRYLAERRFDEHVAAAAEETGSAAVLRRHFVTEGTFAWAEHEKLHIAKTGVRLEPNAQSGGKRGRWFATEWPSGVNGDAQAKAADEGRPRKGSAS